MVKYRLSQKNNLYNVKLEKKILLKMKIQDEKTFN